MARRKKTGLAAFMDNFSITGLLLHPAMLFVMFNAAMATTAVWCWDQYQDKIVDPNVTMLTADRIQLNQQPAWTKTNLREAILSSSQQPKSLLDPFLISDVAATCQSIGWVEQIDSMKKTREGLQVDLVYREPIAAVELNAKTVPGWKAAEKLVPIDRTGVIMPEKLAIRGATPSIHIYHCDENKTQAPKHLNQIYQWTTWPDTRVTEAAAIIEVLAADWQATGLSRVISRQLVKDASDRTIPFELWTAKWEKAATVLWGNAPGNELQNEADWQQKMAALQQYVQQHGPLNSLPPSIIDVRSGKAIVVGQGLTVGFRPASDVR